MASIEGPWTLYSMDPYIYMDGIDREKHVSKLYQSGLFCYQ